MRHLSKCKVLGFLHCRHIRSVRSSVPALPPRGLCKGSWSLPRGKILSYHGRKPNETMAPPLQARITEMIFPLDRPTTVGRQLVGVRGKLQTPLRPQSHALVYLAPSPIVHDPSFVSYIFPDRSFDTPLFRIPTAKSRKWHAIVFCLKACSP